MAALNFKWPKPNFAPKTKEIFKSNSPQSIYFTRYTVAAAQSEGTQGRVSEEEDYSNSATDSGLLQSAQARLNLLEQLTSSSISSSTATATATATAAGADEGYESDSRPIVGKRTIREQLAQIVGDRDDDFSIPLGKNLKKVSPKFLTISQKRNIRRQSYLNQVSERNDSVFFATIGAFVILPPIVILGIAILTGYVQLFP